MAKAIIDQAARKLGRRLPAAEKLFIESRLSFIALEAVEDTVKDLSTDELIQHLNSASSQQSDE